MATHPSTRRVGRSAVEAALRDIASTRLKPQTDSMLRVLLSFKALRRQTDTVDTSTIREVVQQLFTIVPTPDGLSEATFRGTIRLRGTNGGLVWMNNDSYRGSIQDYAGPTSQGRMLFEDENYRRPLVPDAVDHVVGTLGNPGSYAWPSRDALAVIVLRDEPLPPTTSWLELQERARRTLGLEEWEWMSITGPPTLAGDPFDGPEWDPTDLSEELKANTVQTEPAHQQPLTVVAPHAELQVQRVVKALGEHGSSAIVALSGVPGTSKSYVARRAARAFASEGCLREIQFSPGYTYEEFMEGPRYGDGMVVNVQPGAFLELNAQALENPDRQYVLLIEEFTRADLPRVLGELLTYVEYRHEEDVFTTMYDRGKDTRIAPNIAILATYNPADRSAVSVDAALIRRMRILDFPPDVNLLSEILSDPSRNLSAPAIKTLTSLFEACREQVGAERFGDTMPFGHAVFASVHTERDLHGLWHEELRPMLVRPHAPKHELHDRILEHYPWAASADHVVSLDAVPVASVLPLTDSIAD